MNHYFTNSEIKSNLKDFKIKILEQEYIFTTDNGVFSKRGFDFGSRLLVECLKEESLQGRALEVGCGYGIIGIILSRILNLEVDMVDVNNRAIHLTEMNIKQNNSSSNVFYSDCYSKIDKKYDYIITNPPIRAGKKVVYDILFNAKDYINPNGFLYFVMRKEQGALSAIRDLEKDYEVLVLKKHKGYVIAKVKFN